MPTIGNRTGARPDVGCGRILASGPDSLPVGGLSGGFWVRPTDPEVCPFEPSPAHAGRFFEPGIGSVPDGFSIFDLDWALPLVTLTPTPGIVFLRVCVFIGLAKARGTTGDRALQRGIVILVPIHLWIFPTRCFHKDKSNHDGLHAIDPMRGILACFSIRAEQLFRTLLLSVPMSVPDFTLPASLINIFFRREFSARRGDTTASRPPTTPRSR